MPERGEPGERSPAAILAECEEILADLRAHLRAPTRLPGLHLEPIEVAELEALLGSSAPLTPASLMLAVERLASMRIGDIKIPFTPGQMAELQHRASKRGRTVEMEMRAVVARIEEEVFYKGGG